MEETDQSSELLRGWELTGYGVEKTAERDPRNLQGVPFRDLDNC